VDSAQCDALVFFGIMGNLAYKKIFPSLQAMVKRGELKVPVIGVAKSGWTLDQLRPPAQGKDGVVAYKSAHIEPVESELVVNSAHSTQGVPATIEEVRRILYMHLEVSRERAARASL